MEHAKTAFLVEALESLNKEALVFEKYKMERLEEANFTSVFKKRLFLGENFEMALRSTDQSDSIEVVTINSKVQPLSREDGGHNCSTVLRRGENTLWKFRPVRSVFIPLLR